MPKEVLGIHASSSDISVRKARLVARALMHAPIEGDLDTVMGLPERYLFLGVGARSSINGRLYTHGGKLVASIDSFNVTRQLQGFGIGARLFKAYVAESKAIGAEELWSDSVSNVALALREKLLGRDCLRFYDGDHLEYGFLPLSLEQAIQMNNRVDELDAANPDRPWDTDHVGVFVDLAQIDTSQWELPQVVQLRG